MDQRKGSPKDDLPIIGDYSEAANARLRAESQQARSPPAESQPAAAPAPTSAASRPGAAPLRVDPGDVRRHAKLRQQRERAGPFGKILRYGFAALALLIAFAVYRNFETLRGVTVDVSALTSLFRDGSGGGSDGTSILGGEPETVAVEAAGVVGAAIPTSLDGAPPAEEANVAEAPAGGSTAAEPVAAAPELPPPEPEPPPPGPETFEFGLTTMSVSEADASAAVIILRNGDRRRASSITWSTRNGTATPGVDYADLGAVAVRFAAGEQNRTIHIPIVGDRSVEGPETFFVSLATNESAGGAAEQPQQLEVIINDDD